MSKMASIANEMNYHGLSLEETTAYKEFEKKGIKITQADVDAGAAYNSSMGREGEKAVIATLKGPADASAEAAKKAQAAADAAKKASNQTVKATGAAGGAAGGAPSAAPGPAAPASSRPVHRRWCRRDRTAVHPRNEPALGTRR